MSRDIEWFNPLECDAGKVRLVSLEHKKAKVALDEKYYWVNTATGRTVDDNDYYRVRNAPSLTKQELLMALWQSSVDNGTPWATQQQIGSMFVESILEKFELREKLCQNQ